MNTTKFVKMSHKLPIIKNTTTEFEFELELKVKS